MSDLFAIGASGVRAYQTALDTTSENIANMGAAGYVRRTTDLREVAAAGGRNDNRQLPGMGVLAAGIGRDADTYRAAEVRSSGADLAKTQTSAAWLDRINGALTGDQLGDRLTGFFNSATNLAASPSAAAPRAVMLQAASDVAGAFTGTASALDQVQADLDASAEDDVAKLNALGIALGKVNDGLGRVQSGSNGAAALQDQRDQLVEQMSSLSDVSVAADSLGRATVKLGGATGATMVDATSVGSVTYVRNAAGAVSYAVHRDDGMTIATPNGGSLAGAADGAQRAADARSRLDGLASGFAAGANEVQAQGRDLNALPGGALFSGTGARLGLSLTDPSGIAAAAVGEGPGGNGNLAALAALRQSGGAESSVTDLVTTNAAALAARKTVQTAQTTIHDAAVSARDSQSGVNLDTEAVDLMRFQQAYSASSRVIQVARDTFQSILDIH